jgi:hypothetical protein
MSDLELRYLILLQAEINLLDFGSWEMNNTNDLWDNNILLEFTATAKSYTLSQSRHVKQPQTLQWAKLLS